MVSTAVDGDGDDDETQLLNSDSDSTPPPSLIEHPTEDLFGDTVPLDDPAGETQALDDSDPGSPEIDLWGQTEALDEYEETAVADYESEGTEERTAVVLSDDDDGEGLRDDATTPHGTGGGGVDRVEEKDVAVDSEGATDEEGSRGDHAVSSSLHSRGSCQSNPGDHVVSTSLHSRGSCQSNPGTVRKSIAAVRAASLRISGLSAAHTIAMKKSDTVSTYDGSSRKENSSVGCPTGTNGVGMKKFANGSTDLISLGNRDCEVDLEDGIEISHRCTQDYHRDETKSRTNNPRVKKLFDDVIPPEREETTSKADNITGIVESPHFLVSDHAVGGLSYIDSQEPGDLSQANAYVDFLLANDVGSFQEFNTGKMEIVKTPTSSVKGTHSLARKVDRRSPVGKVGTYEWIDSLEDEGGGEFFSKRKDIFFGSSGGARKSRSQPPKPKRPIAVDKPEEKEGAHPTISQKITNLTRSDTRVMLSNTSRYENAKTKKNLFKNVDEPSNSKSTVQQLVTEVDGGMEGMLDVGPDTQMAAEAMEALVHGSPVRYETKEDEHPLSGKVSGNSSKGVTKCRNLSKPDSLKSSTSITNSEGITTRSKIGTSTKSRRGSPKMSIKQTSKPRTRNSLEKSTVQTKAKREKQKVDATCSAEIGLRRSVKGNTAQGKVDETFTSNVNNCLTSLTLNVQLSVSNELIPGKHHASATPVAHRTRRSRLSTSSQRNKNSYNEPSKDKDGVVDVKSSDAMKIENRPSKIKRKGSDQTTISEKEIEGHTKSHGDEPNISSLVNERHPKRRRTNLTGKPNIRGKLNNSSISIDGMATSYVQSSTRQGKAKIFIRSVSELLATAKRRKRSVSALEGSKNNDMPSNTSKVPVVSGARTRTPVNSPSLTTYLEKDSMENSARTVLRKSGLTDATNADVTVVMGHNVHIKELATSRDVESASYVKDSEENIQLDGSSIEKIQHSDLPCNTPSKAVDAVSPVFMAQDPPRTPCNRRTSRSAVVRELIRLEGAERSPTGMSKDSRRRKDMGSVRVLFSHHLDEDAIKQQKKILARLGVPIASSMSDATHFVTDTFARTRNMLEAIALGKPVVTHLWLESCGQASCFIDEKNYILRDAKKEKEIGFKMPVSLARANSCPLLEGIRVFITPNTKPGREIIASLVKAAHGQPLERIGRSALKDDKVPDDLLVISCEEDFTICKPLLEKGNMVFSAELILNGIVIQKLEYERHQLFHDHVKRTRSTIWLRREDDSQFLPVTRCT